MDVRCLSGHCPAWQNRTKVGLKPCRKAKQTSNAFAAKSNQGGIETCAHEGDRRDNAGAKSNQGGIETLLDVLKIERHQRGKIEPRWD